MRPAEIQDDLIIKAGRELVEAGRQVNGFALRQKIGGGNPSRLKAVWDAYVGRQATKPEPIKLPPEIADKVASFAKALSDQVAAIARDLHTTAHRDAHFKGVRT